MSKTKPAPVQEAKPADQVQEVQPQAGGSYLRQPDGSLLPNPAPDAPNETATQE